MNRRLWIRYFLMQVFFNPLLAIRKHYTIAFYKLMCWQLGQWSRRSSIYLPQFVASKVLLRFNLLLCSECSSGFTRGLEWDSSVLRCLGMWFWKTVWTNGICRSLWSVWLFTYQRVGNGSEGFWLISLHDCYIGFTGAAPQNDPIFLTTVYCFLSFFRQMLSQHSREAINN